VSADTRADIRVRVAYDSASSLCYVAHRAMQRLAGELARRTRHAGEQGVAGVPSFLVGEWPIAGIQCDATMRSMLSRFAARQRKAVS